MINTQTSSSKTINLEKLDEIDVANDSYESYRYGKLVKTETNYISKKIIIDNMEQEKLEAVYTLTFIDHKTKEKESFQSSFLPKLNEKYFYYVDNGFAKGISNNKDNFASFIFETASITGNQKECKFMFCLLTTGFFMFIFLFIASYFNINNNTQFFITFARYFSISGIILSPFIFGVYFLWNKRMKVEKIKIKKYIDDLL